MYLVDQIIAIDLYCSANRVFLIVDSGMASSGASPRGGFVIDVRHVVQVAPFPVPARGRCPGPDRQAPLPVLPAQAGGPARPRVQRRPPRRRDLHAVGRLEVQLAIRAPPNPERTVVEPAMVRRAQREPVRNVRGAAPPPLDDVVAARAARQHRAAGEPAGPVTRLQRPPLPGRLGPGGSGVRRPRYRAGLAKQGSPMLRWAAVEAAKHR